MRSLGFMLGMAAVVLLGALTVAFSQEDRFRAQVTYIYDGDTMTADLAMGLGIVLTEQRLRLACIDTPELRGDERPEGLRVRDAVRSWLAEGTATVRIDGRGKYGRWIAWVTPDGWGETLNARLLREGMAVVPGYADDCGEIQE